MGFLKCYNNSFSFKLIITVSTSLSYHYHYLDCLNLMDFFLLNNLFCDSSSSRKKTNNSNNMNTKDFLNKPVHHRDFEI